VWKIHRRVTRCDLSCGQRRVSRIPKISTYAESQTSHERTGFSRGKRNGPAASFIHTRVERNERGAMTTERDDDANESEGEDDDNVVTAKRAISSRQSRSSRSSRFDRAQRGARMTNRIILGDHGRFLTVDLPRNSLSLSCGSLVAPCPLKLFSDSQERHGDGTTLTPQPVSALKPPLLYIPFGVSSRQQRGVKTGRRCRP